MPEVTQAHTPGSDKVRKWYSIKKPAIAGIILLCLFFTGWLIKIKVFKPEPKSLYEVLVVVRPRDGDPRSSLGAGDVLVLQKDKHSWSNSERTSYLILNLELTEEQAGLLISPQTRERDMDELSAEEKQRYEEERTSAEESDREVSPEFVSETVLARAYRIDLEKLDFTDPDSLGGGQPFTGEVFDWSIVEKKKQLK